jgi:aspartate 1-decarboxylase
MYGVEFETLLPKTNEKVTVIAHCKSINGYDVNGLTLKFVNGNDVVIIISYDKDFFEEVEQEANNLLLEDYYNSEFSCLM